MRKQYRAIFPLLLLGIAPVGFAAETELISTRITPVTANSVSRGYGISADGRYVMFESEAKDLVPNDTDRNPDVFVRDLQAGTVVRVNVSSSGAQANDHNALANPSISANGRYVTFSSTASNLVSADTNGAVDAFVHDLQTGVTERVDVKSGGGQISDGSVTLNAISGDGRFVVFTSSAANVVPGDTNGESDVFLRDRQMNTTQRVSLTSSGAQANGGSLTPTISADGRYVAFVSSADNLVANDSNAARDVFVRDLQAGTTKMVSVASNGARANDRSEGRVCISADGRYVAFESNASNLAPGDDAHLVDVFVRDVQAATTQLVDVTTAGEKAKSTADLSSISADGRYVFFDSSAFNLLPPTASARTNAFMRDLLAKTTTRLSVTPSGADFEGQSFAAILSADGTSLIFTSDAGNVVAKDFNKLADVFLRNMQTSAISAVSRWAVPSEAAGDSQVARQQAITPDARYVVFDSSALNVVAGDSNDASDVFLRDRQNGTIERISVDSGGNEANGNSANGSISSSGRYVAFESIATNLVPGDSPLAADVFLKDRQTGVTELISVSSGGVPGDGRSFAPSISADGRFVAFLSKAANLAPGVTNGSIHVFVRDRQNRTTENITVRIDGKQSVLFTNTASISADGRYVAFDSADPDLVAGQIPNQGTDVFVRDRQSGTTEIVSVTSQGAQVSGRNNTAMISGDGRFVTFVSSAPNLVPGDTNNSDDIFVHDRQTGTTERVSVNSSGAQANGNSSLPSISGGGRFVAFNSNASNLVPDDTNGFADIFVRDRQKGVTERVSLNANGGQGESPSYTNSISEDGRFVAFYSYSQLDSDLNDLLDVYLRDRSTSGDVNYSLTPSAGIDFGSQPINTTSTARKFTVTNTGSAAFPVSSVATIGANRALFMATSSCPSSLAPGATCIIRVTFRPTATGFKQATLRVVAGGLTRNRTLSGTGVTAAH